MLDDIVQSNLGFVMVQTETIEVIQLSGGRKG